MKEKNFIPGAGRQGGRGPRQKPAMPKGSRPFPRSGAAEKGAAQGKSGALPPKGRFDWRKGKPELQDRAPLNKPFGEFPKQRERHAEQPSDRRYGRPGTRDTYQPRQGRGRLAPDLPSPAAKRFGPASRQSMPPVRAPKAQPVMPPPQPPHRNDDVLSEEEAIAAGINLLTGRNPIREALKAGRDLEKLMVAKGDISGSARQIVSMARDAGVKVQFVDRSRLDQMVKNHQGMVAYASAYQYADLEEVFIEAQSRGEDPFIVILDQVTDPHNLGAVIRTAVCAGAHGVIVPLHRAVGLTPAAVKASAGGVEHIKVVRVGNLNQTIKALKDRGIWIYAADQEGTDYRGVSISGPCAVVIGSEGEGISPLTLSLCDYRLKIPMSGEIGSLNASVAAGILMYAVFNSRSPQ